MSKYLCREDMERIATSVVEDFLKQGGHPDNQSRAGENSPLCYACMYDKTEIAKLLIEAGADVNFKGAYGRTPLMYASQKNNLGICALLIGKGADINVKNDGGDNILMDMPSPEKLSAETIHWLIKNGVDIHYLNEKRNCTVLDLAVMCQTNELVKILVGSGADGARDGWHEKAFIESLHGREEELSLYFLDHYKGKGVPGGISALTMASGSGKYRTFKRMLALATETEKKEWIHSSGLADSFQSAAYKGNTQLCQSLLEAGADVNRPSWGDSPLHTASHYGRTDIVKLLLDHGADVEKRDPEGNTSLILAASGGHVDIIKMLLAAGADIHVQNKAGWTALMQAALFGFPEALLLLLEQGGDPNDKAEQERNITALMLACNSGNEANVALLLDRGADPFARDDIGLTAHDYTRFAQSYHPGILALLPPVPVQPEPQVPLPKTSPDLCPICKGVKPYESRRVSGYGEDLRKHFFRVMTLLEAGPEVQEGYKYYSRTSYYQCPRCNSRYKKRETEDMDDVPTRYELELWRISEGEQK